MGFCERIVEIQRILLGANGGDSTTEELFEETSNELVGVSTQLRDEVLRMGMDKRFKESDWVVDDARLGVGRLQQIIEYAFVRATSSAEYHFTRVSIYKFEEVRVILVPLLHSSSCVTLVHLQQHESIVLLLPKDHRKELVVAGGTGEGSLNWRDSFLATHYIFPLYCRTFTIVLHHENKYEEALVGYVEKLVSLVGSICTDQRHEADSWATYELQLYIQEFSALKQLLNSAPGEGSPRDTRYSRAEMTRFDSSFGYHTENITHKFEGKLMNLVPFEGHKQQLSSDLTSVYTVTSRPVTSCILVDTLVLLHKFIGKALLLGISESHAHLLHHHCVWGIVAINIDIVNFINGYQATTSAALSVMLLGVKTGKSNGSFSAREEATTVVINQVISSSRESQHLYATKIITIKRHREGSFRTYPVVTTAISGSSSAKEIRACEGCLLIGVGGNMKDDYICLHRLQFYVLVLLQIKNHQLSDTISIQLFTHTHLTTKGSSDEWFWIFKVPGVEACEVNISQGFRDKVSSLHNCALHWPSSFHILEDKNNLKEWDLSRTGYGLPHLLRADQMLFSKNSISRRVSGMFRYLRPFSLISFNLL